jgi:cytochrome c-type biogenesis protein
VVGRIPVAFIAGFFSVIHPCVLPLVPGYLSTVSAVDVNRFGQRGAARRIVLGSVPFIVGFTAVFVLLGTAAAALFDVAPLNQSTLESIAGFILVVVGFAFMGLLPWTERVALPSVLMRARGLGSSAVLGGAFAVCAAPCIGPVLASVLVLAGDAGTVAQGSILLAVYSAGLACAFLLAGLAFARAMGAFRWLRDRFVYIRAAGGAVLVVFGLLLFFGRFGAVRALANRLLGPLGLGV